MSFKGDSFETGLTTDFILGNKEIVTDFFGDNRTTWYAKLLQGGSTFLKTSLDSQDEYDEGTTEEMTPDAPPLEPERVTPERAKNIEAFFVAYPEARDAFQEYARRAVAEGV